MRRLDRPCAFHLPAARVKIVAAEWATMQDCQARRATSFYKSSRPPTLAKISIWVKVHLMTRAHALRLLLFVVLVFFFCAARTTVIAETWEPVSTGFSTDIVIATSGGNTSAEVKLTCPNSGYRVLDWGQVGRTDNEFFVDAKVERWTGVSAQMITTIAHVYALGTVPPGTYSFAVKVYGSVVARQQFIIGSAAPAPRLLTEENTDHAIAL